MRTHEVERSAGGGVGGGVTGGAGVSPACPVCGGARSRDMGPPCYRRPTRVAGVPIRVDDLNLRHFACPDCAYQFVFPRLPRDRLMQCYGSAPEAHWKTDPAVMGAYRFYDQKRAILERFSPGRRALDLGCYDGGFLEYLGPGWGRRGIEPSPVAAAAAGRRGVDVIAPTLDGVDWARHEETADAVICLDVMEHVGDPVATLRGAARLLRPGGVMLIETGDVGAWQWRLRGKRYWYCGIVEHVGFFGRRSITKAAELAGMDMAYFERTRHDRGSAADVAACVVKGVGHLALRAAAALRVPMSERLRSIAGGPSPGSWGIRDHFLAVLRKPE